MSEKFPINGFGQLELNNCAFRRDGRIEAQCALDTADFSESAPLENGMLVAVDKANSKIKKPTDTSLPFALNYSTEHIYDERNKGLKDYKMVPGEFLPRVGYLSVGDLFTTNCLSFNSTDYTNFSALETALGTLGETAVYGGYDSSARICLQASLPTEGPKFKAVKYYTMPDGQKAVKLQVLA